MTSTPQPPESRTSRHRGIWLNKLLTRRPRWWVRYVEDAPPSLTERRTRKWVHVPMDCVLTQLSTSKSKFHDAPRFEGHPHEECETMLSVAEGEMTADDLARIVHRRPAFRRECVRFFAPVRLKQSGYTAVRDPQPGFANHASIAAPGVLLTDIESLKAWWTDSNRVTLSEIATGGRREPSAH